MPQDLRLVKYLPAFFLVLVFLTALPVYAAETTPAPVANTPVATHYAIPAPAKDWLIERFDTATDTPAPAQDIKHLLRFMQGYYLHPVQSDIPAFLHLVDQTKLLEKHPQIFALMSGFICRLATLNAEKIHDWLKGQDYSPKTLAMLQYALWRSGHLNDPAIAKFFTERPVYLSTTPGTLAASALRTPEDVDLMWGGFLATGDEFYINKLVSALDPPAGEMNESVRNLLIATVAASLKANALDHEIVLRVLKKRLDAAKDNENLRQKITALLPQTTPGMKFFVHHGYFGAALVAADLKDIMTQVTKKADEPLSFPLKTLARVGEKIGFLIVYSGMTLTDDLTANLDFDMTLTAPNGTVMQEGSLHHHLAYAGKLQSRFDVLHTPSFMGVEFTPEDATGIYHLDATLHDNIAQLDLPLHLAIRLLDKQEAMAQEKAAAAPKTPKETPVYSQLNQ